MALTALATLSQQQLAQAMNLHQVHQMQQLMQNQITQAMYNCYNTPTSSSSTLGSWFTNTSTTATTTTVPVSISNNVINTLYSTQHILDAMDSNLVRDVLKLMGECSIQDGESCTITLPDGGVLQVERDGSYKINDRNSRVIYRASRVRDFNPFLNASDKLEDFIKFCGEAGVKQDEVLGIPIKHFIAWLIVESAKADKEPEPDIPLLPDLRNENRPHCNSCGRFISKKLKAKKIDYCRVSCFEVALHAVV